MDAAKLLPYRRTAGVLLLVSLLPLAGCQIFDAGPAATSTPVETVEPEPPQVVSTDPEDDEVLSEVAEYVQNVERANAARSTDAQLAADSSPLEPVDPARLAPVLPADPRIEIIPEPAPDVTVTPPAAAEPEPVVPKNPPALVSARVYSAADFATGVPGSFPETAINSALSAQTLPSNLREWLDLLSESDEDTFNAQVRVRMLRALAGDFSGAREPLKLVPAEQQTLAARFIEAWIGIQEAPGGDPATAISAAAIEIDRLLESLRHMSALSIPVVALCSEVRGFGQYDELEPAQFLTGLANEFVLYCEVRDFVSEQGADGWWLTRFDLTTTILNHAGDTVLELRDSDITDRCRNRRNDCFIPRLVRLPATLSPGRYVAKVTIADKLGAKVAQQATPFRIIARP